jgi:hypothetical protein
VYGWCGVVIGRGRVHGGDEEGIELMDFIYIKEIE